MSALDLFPSLSSVATGDSRFIDTFVCAITEYGGTKQTRQLSYSSWSLENAPILGVRKKER